MVLVLEADMNIARVNHTMDSWVIFKSFTFKNKGLEV